jgi:hypothetical protein
MAKTGERYAVARRQVVGADPGRPMSELATDLVVDHGWQLRGGTDPDASALTNILANRGVHGPDGPLSEALVFAASGGLGAGYILWEFKHDDSRHVVLGFAHRWQYFEDRVRAATKRLGVAAELTHTGGAKSAADGLRRTLERGDAVVVWPDRYHVGYWNVPEWLDGHGGHPVVAYAIDRDRVHVDDRNLGPLTVAVDDLDRARARVGSYKNAALVVRTRDTVIDADRLRAVMHDGLSVVVDHLSSQSDSFSLPAWRKWSRLLLDPRNAKGWPNVFADRRSLLTAVLSVWEGVSTAGMTGGHLRGLFADSLDEAADLLGLAALSKEADAWREVARLWDGLAETAAPITVPEVLRARELTASVAAAIAEGDEGAADRTAAAEELWALRARYASSPPWDADRDGEFFAAMSAQLETIFETETAAVRRLAVIVGPG